MRSLSVVLPESMWAETPKLRTLARFMVLSGHFGGGRDCGRRPGYGFNDAVLPTATNSHGALRSHQPWPARTLTRAIVAEREASKQSGGRGRHNRGIFAAIGAIRRAASQRTASREVDEPCIVVEFGTLTRANPRKRPYFRQMNGHGGNANRAAGWWIGYEGERQMKTYHLEPWASAQRLISSAGTRWRPVI